MSDLHTEFDRPAILTEDDAPLVLAGGEVLVLAGDIGVDGNVAWLLSQAHKYNNVILVDGNHEFYHGDIATTHTKIAEQLPPNVHYLEQGIADVDGQRFLGTTLWGGYEHGSLASLGQANMGMNDHKIITNAGRIFTAEEAYALNQLNIKWLMDNVRKHDVVVTHHAPHFKSVDTSRYGDVPLNGAYYSDLESFILDAKPKLWFHGHIHRTNDYMIGETHILTNPRGYVNYEENPNFNKGATVEV